MPSEAFSVSAKVGVKQQVARLKQMQNELKFLKKQINQQIKEKQVEVALQGHKRDAAANLRRLAAAPYELVTKNIDSMLVQLDGVKVKPENPQLVEKAKALESIPNKAAKPDVQEEKPSERLETLLIATLRPASRTIATRWTTLTTAFRALARGAAACRAPAVIVVVGDRTSLVVALSEGNGSIGGAIAANHRAQII